MATKAPFSVAYNQKSQTTHFRKMSHRLFQLAELPAVWWSMNCDTGDVYAASCSSLQRTKQWLMRAHRRVNMQCSAIFVLLHVSSLNSILFRTMQRSKRLAYLYACLHTVVSLIAIA